MNNERDTEMDEQNARLHIDVLITIITKILLTTKVHKPCHIQAVCIQMACHPPSLQPASTTAKQ